MHLRCRIAVYFKLVKCIENISTRKKIAKDVHMNSFEIETFDRFQLPKVMKLKFVERNLPVNLAVFPWSIYRP